MAGRGRRGPDRLAPGRRTPAPEGEAGWAGFLARLPGALALGVPPGTAARRT